MRGDLREELPAEGFHVLESYEDGLALAGPNEGADRTNYRAFYVTLEGLPHIGRYRRCMVCSPDAPERAPPARVTSKRGATLGTSDVGRVTVDGPIERAEHTRAGTTVTLESGEELALAPGETVCFVKQQPAVRPAM